MKAKMNRLKFRQGYRPVAPVMTSEFAQELFGEDFRSPYMSFAPRIDTNRMWKARFGQLKDDEAVWQLWQDDMTHVDRTARVQTVDGKDNQWLWR